MDCLESVDLATYKDSAIDLNVYAIVVIDFIRNCAEEYVPMKTD